MNIYIFTASMSIHKLKTLVRRIYKIDQVDYYLSYTSLRASIVL